MSQDPETQSVGAGSMPPATQQQQPSQDQPPPQKPAEGDAAQGPEDGQGEYVEEAVAAAENDDGRGRALQEAAPRKTPTPDDEEDESA